MVKRHKTCLKCKYQLKQMTITQVKMCQRIKSTFEKKMRLKFQNPKFKTLCKMAFLSNTIHKISSRNSTLSIHINIYS